MSAYFQILRSLLLCRELISLSCKHHLPPKNLDMIISCEQMTSLIHVHSSSHPSKSRAVAMQNIASSQTEQHSALLWRSRVMRFKLSLQPSKIQLLFFSLLGHVLLMMTVPVLIWGVKKHKQSLVQWLWLLDQEERIQGNTPLTVMLTQQCVCRRSLTYLKGGHLFQ